MKTKTHNRADLYMGIGQAVNELRRIQDHLMRFGLTEEQQLDGAESAIKAVAEYLAVPEKMYGFDDLCTSQIKEKTNAP